MKRLLIVVLVLTSFTVYAQQHFRILKSDDCYFKSSPTKHITKHNYYFVACHKYRIYFYNKQEARNALLLFHAEVVSFDEIFELSGIHLPAAPPDLAQPYERLMMQGSAIMITSIRLERAKMNDIVVIDLTSKLQNNASIFIPVASVRDLSCLTKGSKRGKAEVEYEL